MTVNGKKFTVVGIIDPIGNSLDDRTIWMPEDIFEDLFEPFVSSKSTGTGLGLTITNDIVRQHGGEIQAENNSDGGATFKVWFPIKGGD